MGEVGRAEPRLSTVEEQGLVPGATPEGFGLLYVGSFIIYADRFAIPPILLAISRDLRAPLGAVTAVASVYFLLYGLMQLPYGLLSDRVGRVRVLRVALLGMSLANALSAVAPTLGALVAGKALTAGLIAAILPTSLVYLGDQVPFDRRQQAIVNVLAAGALGTAVATVGAGLLARYDAWRVVFAVPAVMGLALAVVIGRLPEPVRQQRGAGPIAQLRRVMARPWAAFVIVLSVAEGAVMVGLLTYLAPALEARGHGAAVAGLVVATYGVAVFGGMQVVKGVLRRLGISAAALIAVGGTLLILAYLTAAIEQGIVNILLASMLVAFGYCFMHSTLQTWATEVVPEARGTATSLFVTGVYTGAALGTAAVSGLADATRYQALFALAAAATLPVLLVGALGRSRYEAARAATITRLGQTN